MTTTSSYFERDIKHQAGFLFSLAGFIDLIGIILAEAVYGRDYNIYDYTISDLARKVSSGAILNTSLLFSGMCIVFGAYLLYQYKHRPLFDGLLVISGLGQIGISIFTFITGPIHLGYAISTFLASTVAIILSTYFIKGWFGLFSSIAGCISVIGIFGFAILAPILGQGGAERLFTYACLLWLVAFGGYLMRGQGHARRLEEEVVVTR